MLNEESILITDSDLAFMHSLAFHLMDNGFRPTLIADFSAAITEIVKGTFEIAIFEFNRPVLNNNFKGQLSTRSGNTELILTTRTCSIGAERAARELSPAFYFVKPVEPSDIYAVVLRIIEMRSKRIMAALQRMEQRERVRNG